MKARVLSILRHAGVLAALLSAAAAMAFGARVQGYSHAQLPLALLGAAPLPGAFAFNVLAFVLPGLLVATVAIRLRSAIDAAGDPAPRWSTRIGAQSMLLASLAFAAQGLWPLDASDLDGGGSSRHAAAWMAWLLASTLGAALLGTRLRPRRGFATASVCVAIALPLLAFVLPALVPAGITQRLAFAAWFAWAIGAGAFAANARQP